MPKGELGEAILVAIVRGDVAWRLVRDLCRELPHHSASVRREIQRLELNGMIERWELPRKIGLAITLTPLSAARMGVEIQEFGAAEVPRFVDAGKEPAPVRVRPEHWGSRPLLADLPAEEAAEICDIDDQEPDIDPMPRVILGCVVEPLKPRPRSNKPSRKRRGRS